jgi:hypothetical protein
VVQAKVPALPGAHGVGLACSMIGLSIAVVLVMMLSVL